MKTALVLGIAVFTVAGCHSANSPDGLVASASVAPGSFRAGTPVDVTVTVVNEGSRTRTIEINPCPEPFVVTTLSGEVIGPGVRICSAYSQQHELAPGEQYVFELRWSGDRKGGGTPDSNVPLGPGTYLLRAVVTAVGGPVESEAVQFTVTQ